MISDHPVFFISDSLIVAGCGGMLLRQLCQHHRCQHQGAAEIFPPAEAVSQNRRTGNGGEHGFQTQQQRDHRGVGAFLSQNLQRIAHAAGKETRIQNGARRHGQARPGGMLEKQGANQGKRCDKEELTAGQLHAVYHGDKVIHQKDLCCKHKGAQHHAEVAGGDGKALRDAQAVQSRHRHSHAEGSPLLGVYQAASDRL